MKKHFLLLLLTFASLQVYAANKHICTRGKWNIAEETAHNEWNPGWMLKAEKNGQSTDLHFHSRSLQKLWESAHFLILKDSGIADSSSSILVIHMPEDSVPFIIYQSADPALSEEYEVELIEACEKGNGLDLKIRIFDERNGQNQYTIQHKITPSA